MHGLLQDMEGGYARRIAFVVPPGATWPLPVYELALLAAERASSLSLDVQLTILTPEEAPLGIFGRTASEEVDRVLNAAGIVVVTSTHVADVHGGVVADRSGAALVRADRVVTLPRLEGPHLAGLPADPNGFLPVDDHGAVRGTDGVFAAGDGTSFPIKQGGIAAQMADAAARMIAERAGATVLPAPFRPMLRAKLLTGSGAKFLSEAITGGAGAEASSATDQSLWWPPSKVAAPYLAPYLEQQVAVSLVR
jgi:sulfide:quinone oxidoreductase